jgi:hypothetical protein
MSNQPINVDMDDILGTGVYDNITYREASRLPPNVQAIIPDYSKAVPLLLTHPFPTMLGPKASGLTNAKTCFGHSAQAGTIDDLALAAIPPVRWIDDLGTELRRRWEAHEEVGYIQHPLVPDMILPVWIGRYWEEMRRAIIEVGRWEKAVNWLLERQDSPQRDEVLDLITRMPWGLEVWRTQIFDPDRFVGCIADILSWDWVRETHMEVYAAVINSQRPQGWWVSDPFLAQAIMDLPRSEEPIEANQTLLTVQQAVAQLHIRHIIFPVHLENHWIVVHVDLTRKTYEYGMFPTLTTVHLPILTVIPLRT